MFIVATANEIMELPPELVRKGRFDEIFFVDLPDETARATIFDIHLTNRGRTAEDFDLRALAGASDRFSGAEIEQAVVSALYAAHAQKVHVTTQHILDELRQTRPLAVIMAERVTALRDWASQRTVPAH